MIAAQAGLFLAASSSFDSGVEWLLALGCVLALSERSQRELRRTNAELLEAQEGLRRLADRDPLTALQNRRALPEVFRDVRPGEPIFFDEGKIGGVVREVAAGRLRVEITRARRGKAKLRGDRGINLPETDFHLRALTAKDRSDLDFVIEHSDLVGLSFLRSPGDVEELLGELTRRGGERLGIVLKIETRRAFEQLPRLLLVALRSPAPGVMVARGDLGVELGFSRLAEVQEEILWLCEAAHVPVIWATQVLESLAKKGMPSRAEVAISVTTGGSQGASWAKSQPRQRSSSQMPAVTESDLKRLSSSGVRGMSQATGSTWGRTFSRRAGWVRSARTCWTITTTRATIRSALPSSARPRSENCCLARARMPSAPSRIALAQSRIPPHTIALELPSHQHAAAANPTRMDRTVTWLGVIGVR